MNLVYKTFKGTIRIVSSGPSCKDELVWFTMVPNDQEWIRYQYL